MPFSTCCGAHTNYLEIDICPYCLEHCYWEDDEEDDEEEDEEEDEETINKQ